VGNRPALIGQFITVSLERMKVVSSLLALGNLSRSPKGGKSFGRLFDGLT
jgi:hypothetical protein